MVATRSFLETDEWAGRHPADVIGWLRSLTGYLEKSNICSFEAETAGIKIRIVRQRALPEPAGVVAGDVRSPEQVAAQFYCSPGVGIFHSTHPAAPAETGAAFPCVVPAGGIIGFLGVGGLYRPLVADKSLQLEASCVAEGALVGYGAPLFRIAGKGS